MARDHLGYTKIVSPMDGTVIARGIEPGEAVVPGVQSTFDGKALLTIADLSSLLVKVGQFLTAGPLRCRVIGVLANNERFGVGFGFDGVDLVIAPSETMANVDPAVHTSAVVLLRTDDAASNETVKRLVNARLVARHPGLDDFTLYDFSGVMKKFGAVFATMELIVALLAGIALLIGGVGVMNMMLVAVSERVKEIGIRKALGARPREIGMQFLTEAVLLAILGGGTGVVSGLGVAALASVLIARFLTTWQRSLAPGPTAAALVISIGIGILFGWLPAKQAARLDPIACAPRSPCWAW